MVLKINKHNPILKEASASLRKADRAQQQEAVRAGHGVRVKHQPGTEGTHQPLSFGCSEGKLLPQPPGGGRPDLGLGLF